MGSAPASDRERAADAGELRQLPGLSPDAEPRGRAHRLVEPRRRIDVGDADPEMVDVAAARAPIRDGRPRRCCRPGRAGTRRSSRRCTRGAGQVRRRPGTPPRCRPARTRRRARATAPTKPMWSRRVGGVLGVRLREREVVPLGEARRCASARCRACAARFRRTARTPRTVRDADRHVVEHRADDTRSMLRAWWLSGRQAAPSGVFARCASASADAHLAPKSVEPGRSRAPRCQRSFDAPWSSFGQS